MSQRAHHESLPKMRLETRVSFIDFSLKQQNIDTEEQFVRLHTETLLISLPTPDFSMPYNVICLACTVVAIAFGSVHNLTTRRFVVVDKKRQGRVAKFKAWLKRKWKGEPQTEGTKDDKEKTEEETRTEETVTNAGDHGEAEEEQGSDEEDSEIQFNLKNSEMKNRKR